MPIFHKSPNLTSDANFLDLSSGFATDDWFSALPPISEPSFANLSIDMNANGAGGRPGGGGGGGGGGVVTVYTSGDPTVADANEFNIQVNFAGHNWTAKEQAIVKWAADFFSQVITADIRDDTDLNGHLVDDVAITMNISRIDGAGNPLTGNILAQTGNMVVRDAGTADQWLPLTDTITLDSTDLKNPTLAGTWDAIILHEMAHALGFSGFIFGQLGLMDNSQHFTGSNTVAAYGGIVPLDSSASHWSDAFQPAGSLTVMTNELMTATFVPGEETLLSDTTVAVLRDLGYAVQDPSAGAAFLVVDSHLLIA